MAKASYFITIEGIEGVGKSTNIDAIKIYLENLDIDYLVTREPGGTELAEKIRLLLLDNYTEGISDTTELLLIFAARAQHIEEVIRPALDQGKWVICDRFTDATYAYQGGGRGLEREKIAELESLVQGRLRPDLTIILDLDPATGLARAAKRGNLDRFEKEELEFFDRVRESYLHIAEQEPQRCKVVNAAQSVADVKQDILRILADLGV
ncbi:MAG: dTMP kinase [Gammaproteobacteria bacterium]|jgi:dTMP kinase|nr:dTMP kinase [Gammaproteobacteria bacterium]MDP6098405.1 dTMP kinase [Gammaproteobacteria bacterium]|tara:strand:+ start:2138 stop:2764 length:627 start_codon:yes stop_codon:yes gene_type:complete